MDEQKDEIKTKPEQAPQVKVKVIRSQGKSSLIEWQDETGKVLRGTVPIVDVSDENTVSMKTLSQAILYGLDFSDVLQSISINLEYELHKNEIWTATDLLVKRPELLRALGSFQLALLNALIQFAKNPNGGMKDE